MTNTVKIAPAMHYIGVGPRSGQPALVPQGYEVTFYKDDRFEQRRSYGFNMIDELLMITRIKDWTTKGSL